MVVKKETKSPKTRFKKKPLRSMWEYLVLTNTDSRQIESSLNELGQVGWELVAVRTVGSGKIVHYLKRQKI